LLFLRESEKRRYDQFHSSSHKKMRRQRIAQDGIAAGRRDYRSA
jgi:hypothetical protein